MIQPTEWRRETKVSLIYTSLIHVTLLVRLFFLRRSCSGVEVNKYDCRRSLSTFFILEGTDQVISGVFLFDEGKQNSIVSSPLVLMTSEFNLDTCLLFDESEREKGGSDLIIICAIKRFIDLNTSTLKRDISAISFWHSQWSNVNRLVVRIDSRWNHIASRLEFAKTTRSESTVITSSPWPDRKINDVFNSLWSSIITPRCDTWTLFLFEANSLWWCVAHFHRLICNLPSLTLDRISCEKIRLVPSWSSLMISPGHEDECFLSESDPTHQQYMIGKKDKSIWQSSFTFNKTIGERMRKRNKQRKRTSVHQQSIDWVQDRASVIQLCAHSTDHQYAYVYILSWRSISNIISIDTNGT